MTHLSLFSGICGIDLAAHWAGFKTIQFVEKDKFCQKIITKHWPGVPIHSDVTTFDAKPFRGRVALLSGGVPCQGFSIAGFQRGLSDPRSGLFWHVVRVIRECRPLFVLVENVFNLIRLAHDAVIAALEAEGYRTLTFVLRTRLHRRKRVFIVGADPSRIGREWAFHESSVEHATKIPAKRSIVENQGDFFAEVRAATFVRTANGVPGRVDRLRALGNAVVPQQVYPILQAIANEIRRLSK